MTKAKKGFTLIETLLIIAVIAILVSILVPAVSNNTIKARAAVDASNLRTVLGDLNIYVVDAQKDIPEILDASEHPVSVTDPEANLWAVYSYPGFIDVYYVKGSPDSAGSIFYGLDYLADVATNGTSTLSTGKPNVEGTWYAVNNG